MCKIPFLSQMIRLSAGPMAMVGVLFSLGFVRADIAFTGSGASSTLFGETQTISGSTLIQQGSLDLSFVIENGSNTEEYGGQWMGDSLSGTYHYAGDGDLDKEFSISGEGVWGTVWDYQNINYHWLGSDDLTLGIYQNGGGLSGWYSIGSFEPQKISLAGRELLSGSTYQDCLTLDHLTVGGSLPGIAHYLEASVDGSGDSIVLRDSYYTWYRATSLPTSSNKKTRSGRLANIESRSSLAMSLGGSSNILKLIHPTNSSNFIELNPSSGTIKINNVLVLTESAAASTYLTPSTANSTYLRKDASQVALTSGVATGTHSVALGDSNAAGSSSIAMGGATTSTGASYGVAMGLGVATNEGAVAMSAGEASGIYSTAMSGGQAMGAASFAILGQASGDSSVAIGVSTVSESMGEIALGQYTETNTTFSANSWVGTDRLLVVGNGIIDSPSNALVVRKNANMRTGGTLEAKGVIRCAPGGDLSMGSFTSSPSGLGNPATLNAALKYSGE
jgi:hypothetical protein